MSSEKSDLQAVERLNEGFQAIKSEIGKVIIGQEEVIEQLLIAILARGQPKRWT
jgi:MoxR-like ATPase